MPINEPDFHRTPFKPLNPWGRAMPKPKREMRSAAPEQLYQVFVELTKPFRHPSGMVLKKGSLMPVGPKWAVGFAEQFCAKIREQITLGNEKSWNNPQVMACVAKDQPGASQRMIDLFRNAPTMPGN